MENETPRGKRQNPVSDTSSGTAWSLKPELVDRPFGEIDRLFDNLEALRIVFSKESGEEISPEEKDRVSLYSGWGGLSRFFSARSPKWDENGDKLISVLTERALSFVDRSSEGLDETGKDRLKYGISSFYTYQDVTKRLLSVAIGREENDDLVDTFYYSAFRSTPTSFYTPASLVLSMWEAVRRTGFSGGRILEPGAGSGIFLGLMPDEIRQGSRTLAIEKDEMTGRVLQFLYGGDPAFDPRIAPFESIKMPAGRFDLVIGNVPFGDVRVFPEHGTFARQSMSIHNFFLLRSSELLRDGGLMMVLTSNYFLDSKTALSRINMDSLGMKLVAPLRLPEEVFATSGTQAGSDLLVFQKNPSSAVRVFPYEKTSQLSLPETTHKGHVNTLFLDNPETVMGQSSIEENRFGDPVMRVSHPGWEKALDDRISAIVPASVYMPSDVIDLPDALPVGRPGGIPGTMILAGDGKTVLEIDENGTHVPVPLKARDAELLRDLIPLRDILLSIVLKQPDPDVSEEDLVPLRNSLNDRYDNFVRKFGVLSGKTVSRLFSSDPSWPLVAALEIPDLSENRVEKASIFRERTVLPVPRERKAANAMDALTISLDFYGKVVPAYMEKISGQPFDNLKIELEGKIFKQADETWEIADRYLSGNVRKKLEEARILAEEDPSFQSNVDALVSVQPRDLSPSQITVNLGAPWIPEEIIRNFVDELFYEVTYQKPGRFYQASNDRYFSVRRLPIENSWVMAVSKDYRTNRPAMISEYETQRLDFFDLLGDALNQKRPTVYDTDDDGKKIVNPGQTELARERIEKIQEKFAGWIWKDQERAEFLVREYNERFNVWRAPSFDGSHMTFPGMNPRFSMRPHQKDAVFRTLLTGNALYAHVVGAGKTATMIAAAYEQKRLGQFEKPMIIVPNHMLRQFVLEAQRLYPSARILSVSKDDLTKDRRKIFWGKVTMGNWDMVITTHGVFERIKLSPAAEARFLERAVQEYQEFIISLEEGSDREGAASKRSRGMAVKQIAKRLDSFEARLKELKAEEKKDDFPVYFDQMGIRSIFVDEAHYFKGLEIVTKQDRIPGLTGQASQRAFDLFWKTRWIMEQNGGEKGVHFATGTPVANIMAEIFGMQRYLAPRALKQEGVEWFDSWSSMFGQVVSQFELSPEGTGYRKNARFSKYVNVPDLMNMYLQFADVKTANDLDLPTPDVEIQTMAYDRSPFLDRYMKTLAVRAERVRQRGVDPSEDNMLNIMTDARKASISPRFIDPLAVDDPGSKVNGLVENLLRIHRETQSERLTQMVFCDYGTPSKDPGKYSVYDEIRRKLVENGVPDQEIAFIHDASSDDEKEALFQKVRDGAVRVLVGSTLKMGTGTNVQSRLVALHHLDIPWRPADMEQRNGRIARQGNMNDTVQIYVYTTKDSIDVFMLDAVKRKAEFIAQVMKGEAMDRVLDEDDDNMAYQQIMAASTGNDGIRRKIELDQEIQKMERRKQGWQDEKFHAGKRAVALESEIEKLLNEIAEVEKDMDAVTPEEFEMTIGGVVYKSKSEALKPFMERWVESGKHQDAFELGEYAGFRIEKPAMAKSWVRLVRNGVHSMDVMEVSARLFSRIESKIKGFPILLENLKADLKEATGNRKIFLELSEK
ncbi:helicase-related protein, partial [Leptospirillum ferriphilum]|uniref:helicase-related protein n=1 Tax=Leptospirillum ferriphilum TaxID=178606 RepID=UPI00123771B5